MLCVSRLLKSATFPQVRRFSTAATRAKHELEGNLVHLKAAYELAMDISGFQELTEIAQQLETELSEEDIWTKNPKHAQHTMHKLAHINSRLGKLKGIRQSYVDMCEYVDLIVEDSDAHATEHEQHAVIDECLAEVEDVMSEVSAFIDHSLVKPTTDDAMDCLLIGEVGNGGLDAKDWVAMLHRMYLSWSKQRGFEVEEVSVVPDKVAGLRSFMIELKSTPDADCPYGWTRTEMGVHKLVRFSPFDKAHRRQTSHAKIAVIPVHHERRDDFHIEKSDLRIDRYRSSGPGGQHANTTDSAVRITHIPTGTTVSAQESRSQHDNMHTAMTRLKNELWVQHERARIDEANRIKTADGTNVNDSWGDHIRQYVLNPRQYVKDVRSNIVMDGKHAVERVLEDGDLDDFIKAALLLEAGHTLPWRNQK